MRFLQDQDRLNQPLALGWDSLSLPFLRENGEKKTANDPLQELLEQLVEKTEANSGFLTYCYSEIPVAICTEKVNTDLNLNENEHRLLIIGAPFLKGDAYVHPIKVNKRTIGLICINRNPQTWNSHNEDLVNAYACLVAQNIQIQNKQERLTRHAHSLHKKKKELEKIQEYNQNLLSITTHDLSSPLNAVSGYLEMIEQCLTEEKNSQKLQHYYSRIQSGVNDVSEMLTRLNEVVEFKKGFLNLNTIKVDLNWVVKDVCKVLRANAEEKSIILNIHTAQKPVYAEVDVVKFKRVIYNLVSNAIKYTRRQQHIFVYVRADDREAKVYVQDEGIGIPEDKLDAIFKPFVKFDSDTENTLSKGLGLYISSYFMELMGGEIAVKSQSKKGSIFTVTLPLANATVLRAAAI